VVWPLNSQGNGMTRFNIKYATLGHCQTDEYSHQVRMVWSYGRF